jgi:hypothetical protein
MRSDNPSEGSSREAQAFSEPTVYPDFPDGGAPVHLECMRPEVIRDVVREHFETFRACYEQGLRKRKDLQGRIVVKFIIDRRGGVVSVSDYRSSMPDRDVVQCIIRGYSTLVFPPTECDGTIGVIYPIQFDPSRR